MAKPSTRLYVILARNAPVAVIFRRGPSRHVLALSWNTETHEIRRGQWFKGRIYEHRCDLSPSGEKLIYFAAKHRAPLFTWTAVSRPPFLSALAMWPKGDAWGGGGLFTNERTIALNHRASERAVAEGFRLPKSIVVEPMKGRPGWGEDDPIWSERLARDGWILKQLAKGRENKRGSKIWWEYSQPLIWTKAKGSLVLEMHVLGFHEIDGPSDVVEHRVLSSDGELALSLGRSDWADWSRSGELLFARDGRLFRIPVDRSGGLEEPIQVADFRELRFEEVPATSEARVWSGPTPRGPLIEEIGTSQSREDLHR